MICENCKAKMKECYRFTDWDNDGNDQYGTYDECLRIYNEAVSENPTGRYSIYDVSECPKCEDFKDEGILFNEKCPTYNFKEEFYDE